MNAKFRFYLLNYASTRRQRGFALPMVMMVGLVIAVVGATMVIQGMEDNNKVVSQKAKAIADAAAEAGVAQLANFLATNPAAAVNNMADWSDSTKLIAKGATSTTSSNSTSSRITSEMLAGTTPVPNNCPATPPSSTAGTTTTTSESTTTTTETTPNSVEAITAYKTNVSSDVPLNSSDNSKFKPKYRIKNYLWNNGTGTAVIVGLAGSAANGQSIKRVSFPVGEVISSGGTQVTTSGVTNLPSFAGGFASLWVKTIANGDLNNVNTSALSSATNTPSEVYANNCFYNNKQKTPYSYIRTTLTMPNSPATPTSNIVEVDLDKPSSKVSLPLTADIASGANLVNGRYRYKASEIEFNGNGVKLEFKPGYKVTLWVAGKIDPGTADIDNLAAKPTDAVIIGNATSGTVSLSGNGSICNVFMWAPSYNVTLNGGGGGSPNKFCSKPPNSTAVSPNNTGIYWVNRFTGTSSSNSNQNAISDQDATLWPDIVATINGIVPNTFAVTVANQLTSTAGASASTINMGAPTDFAAVDDEYELTPPTTTSVADQTVADQTAADKAAAIAAANNANQCTQAGGTWVTLGPGNSNSKCQ